MTPINKTIPMSELSSLIESLIDEGYDITVTVTGNSMRPMLNHKRDAVTLTKCNCNNLKKGQIPLYKRDNGQYVLHRIVRVNDETYDIIGDRQTKIEYAVSKSSVICVVKSFIRNNKTYSCNNILYRFYSQLWIAIIPCRTAVFKTGHFLKKLLHLT